jgi:type I restriction enzyme, S subunit
MRPDWVVCEFGDLTVNHDARRIPVKAADRRPGPYPYYGASGVVDHVDQFIFDGDYLLVAEDGENLRTRTTPIAFLARGQFWVNNHAHIVTGNERADTRFLMYALSATDIAGFLTGSAIPKLNQARLNKIPIPTPPYGEQRAIAKILGDLDDKIDILREMNRTLEDIARAVFRSWFVNFEPVRAKAVGATSFRGMPQDLFDTLPADFTDAQTLPPGWRSEPLDGLVATPITRGLAPKYIESGGVAVLNQKCVRNWEIDASVARRHDGEVKPPKEKVVELFDILVNSTGVGTLGRVAQLYRIQETTTFDSHLSLVRHDPKKVAPLFLGFELTEREGDIERLGHGSTGQTELNRQKLGALNVNLPPLPVQLHFDGLVAPLVQRKGSNNLEIDTLASLRDTLLPKLISGELEAPSLEALGLTEARDG